MDPSKLDFRCIVCNSNSPSLSELHKHQSSHHTSEELSLSILTLQSFVYHKHYFQTLDAKPLTDICYFYPFCSQLFSEKGKNIEPSFKIFPPNPQQTVPTTECFPSSATKPPEPKTKKKQVPLRHPLTSPTRPTIIKSLSLEAERTSSVNIAPLPVRASHTAFLNSANSLCNDLIKLRRHNSQAKIKRKRLNEKKDRPPKEDNKLKVQKPQRKPKIDEEMKMNNPQNISPSENLETLQIWASKSEESPALGTINTLSAVTLVENLQPIDLQSPTVPTDMINCETALIFNPETGSFQWNPLSCVDKKPEENIGVQVDVPDLDLPNQVTHVPDIH